MCSPQPVSHLTPEDGWTSNIPSESIKTGFRKTTNIFGILWKTCGKSRRRRIFIAANNKLKSQSTTIFHFCGKSALVVGGKTNDDGCDIVGPSAFIRRDSEQIRQFLGRFIPAGQDA